MSVSGTSARAQDKRVGPMMARGLLVLALALLDGDGDGVSTPGVVRGSTRYLRNTLDGGPADLGFAYFADGGAWLLRNHHNAFDAGANADRVPSILDTSNGPAPRAVGARRRSWPGCWPTSYQSI